MADGCLVGSRGRRKAHSLLHFKTAHFLDRPFLWPCMFMTVNLRTVHFYERLLSHNSSSPLHSFRTITGHLLTSCFHALLDMKVQTIDWTIHFQPLKFPLASCLVLAFKSRSGVVFYMSKMNIF